MVIVPEGDGNYSHVSVTCEYSKRPETKRPLSMLLYVSRLRAPPASPWPLSISGRYTHDARRFVVEAEEAQDKLNAVQNSIFSANEEMDRFKLQMNWNQEELEQWALAAKQKEEDNLALQKYARADDVKIKELRYTSKYTRRE